MRFNNAVQRNEADAGHGERPAPDFFRIDSGVGWRIQPLRATRIFLRRDVQDLRQGSECLRVAFGHPGL